MRAGSEAKSKNEAESYWSRHCPDCLTLLTQCQNRGNSELIFVHRNSFMNGRRVITKSDCLGQMLYDLKSLFLYIKKKNNVHFTHNASKMCFVNKLFAIITAYNSRLVISAAKIRGSRIQHNPTVDYEPPQNLIIPKYPDLEIKSSIFFLVKMLQRPTHNFDYKNDNKPKKTTSLITFIIKKFRNKLIKFFFQLNSL
ncbi:hypothetical protein RIR_jg24005.t1 [Rhizophagus irregularis DAOM 181602=DAOM 197198]|nr:hypothetical protein RIR_jg24005.t1 [Rhizophagus irregularis DAOM 181602=DAOM 197198]